MQKQTTGTAKTGTATGRVTRKLEPKPSGFMKWEKHGDLVAGTVTAKEEVDGKNGTRTVATFEPEGGGEIKVDLGSAGLRDYADMIEVGGWFVVTYVGDKPTPKGSMRIFDVETGDAPDVDF